MDGRRQDCNAAIFCSPQVLEEAKTPPLLRRPVEVIAFCDEEGLRRASQSDLMACCIYRQHRPAARLV